MGTLVVASEHDKAVRAATRRVLASPDAPSSFHVNVHPKADAYVFGRDTRRVSGSDRLRDTVAGVSFVISPTAFFQTNVRAAEILVRLVLDAVPVGTRVLDLYAGAGLFALPLALRGNDVLAVEENRAAVADGEASRRLNRVSGDRCRFLARRAEDALRDLARRAERPSLDAAVLDPPREGCAPEVLDTLFGTLAPSTVVYVSCNPEALATDLAAITRRGYRIASLQPVDMFPHTAHVETVAVLIRSAFGSR
jgi:23S rRNA (uracil1939-C5)-methyltransferase